MPERKRTRARSPDKESESGDEMDVRDVADQPKEAVDETTEQAGETAQQTADSAQEAVGSAQGAVGSAQQTVSSELKGAVREAAIEVLSPVARQATSSAAKYAITQGPKLLKDKVLPKVDELGGPVELAKKAGGGVGGLVSGGGDAVGGLVSKIGGGDKGGDEGGAPSGFGRGRRLPIQESVDVAVPLETAYNQFTQFEDFPKFMHRVEKVEQKDDTHLMWHENIWGVRRQWEAEITDQRPNERIAWESTSGSPRQKGAVTFHRLSDRLTRVEVNLDQEPKGIFEKTSSGFRMTRRALKSDLMRFKAFVETREEETGAWRGEVVEGELVEGEEAPEAEEEAAPEGDGEEPRRRREPEPEEYEEEEPEAEAEPEPEEEAPEEEEPEAEAEEEPEAAAEEEPEAEAEEEPEAEEEEEEPRRRRPARRRPPTRRRSPAGGRGGR
jgi:uncharacterized membrane protein